jgi:hypothetical protein
MIMADKKTKQVKLFARELEVLLAAYRNGAYATQAGEVDHLDCKRLQILGLLEEDETLKGKKAKGRKAASLISYALTKAGKARVQLACA